MTLPLQAHREPVPDSVERILINGFSRAAIAASVKNARRMSRLKTRLLRRREGTVRDAER
jgi:hypothetical protein